MSLICILLRRCKTVLFVNPLRRSDFIASFVPRKLFSLVCLRNEKKKISVDFSMDFLESEEIIFNPWIEYPWIENYFIDPWIKFAYK